MSEHFCQFIINFHMLPGEDGDPIFCDKPAGIKLGKEWLCPEHYDSVIKVCKIKSGYLGVSK